MRSASEQAYRRSATWRRAQRRQAFDRLMTWTIWTMVALAAWRCGVLAGWL